MVIDTVKAKEAVFVVDPVVFAVDILQIVPVGINRSLEYGQYGFVKHEGLVVRDL